MIDVDTLPPEKLEPVPFDVLKKAGVVEDSTPTWVRQRQEEARRKAASQRLPRPRSQPEASRISRGELALELCITLQKPPPRLVMVKTA